MLILRVIVTHTAVFVELLLCIWWSYIIFTIKSNIISIKDIFILSKILLNPNNMLSIHELIINKQYAIFNIL